MPAENTANENQLATPVVEAKPESKAPVNEAAKETKVVETNVPNTKVEKAADVAETTDSVKEKPKAAPRKAAKPKAKPKAVEKEAPAATDGEPAKKPAAKKPAKPRTPRKPQAAKPVDLADSGLQMVETKAAAKTAKPAAKPAKPKAPRKPANWKKDEAASNTSEPLVMVETQK